jgi:hypothetical protein
MKRRGKGDRVTRESFEEEEFSERDRDTYEFWIG